MEGLAKSKNVTPDLQAYYMETPVKTTPKWWFWGKITPFPVKGKFSEFFYLGSTEDTDFDVFRQDFMPICPITKKNKKASIR